MAFGPDVLGPVQLIPPGLLGLLQLKQLGKLPGVLNDTVSGVIELRDWYMTARRQTVASVFGQAVNATVTGGLTGLAIPTFQFGGAGAAVAVPAAEYWWVDQLTIDGAFAAAADSVTLVPALITATAPAILQKLGAPNVDTINARLREYSVSADRPFWMFPGDQPCVFVHDIVTATNVPCTLHMRLTRLPI